MEICIRRPAQGTSILGLSELPNRKRKALYRRHGCQIVPVAYFSNDEDAAWVEDFLHELIVCASAIDLNPEPDHENQA